VFFPVLKSLDEIDRITSRGLENSQAVSVELVKYIAQSIDFQFIQRMPKDTDKSKRNYDTLTKELKDAVKKAETASNKIDQFKTHSEKLAKRVKVIEEKS